MKKYILTAFAVFLCSCANNANVIKNNQCFNVSYLDEDLNKIIKCEERSNNDFNNLIISIELTNISNNELNLKYSQDWFYDNGMHVDNLGLAKKELTLQPKETKYIKLGAPANAHNYKIKINKFN